MNPLDLSGASATLLCPIEQLNNHNYNPWKAQVYAKLRAICANQIVDSLEPLPTPYKPLATVLADRTTSTPTPDPLLTAQSKTEAKDWEDRNNKAIETIFNHIDDQLVVELGSIDSSHDIWMKIQT